ncbi:putative OPA3-like protein CG13603, partial [Cotesia glomerata]
WAEVKAKMYVMNLGKPTKVAKLNEQMAIELGANLMGEVIIFTVAGGCLFFEYNRQSVKEAKKEADRQAQVQKFTDDIQTLHESSQEQEKQIKYLTTVVEELAKNPKQKINLEKLKPVELVPSSDLNSPDDLSRKSPDDKSVVHRALDYYEKDVKGTRS